MVAENLAIVVKHGVLSLAPCHPQVGFHRVRGRLCWRKTRLSVTNSNNAKKGQGDNPVVTGAGLHVPANHMSLSVNKVEGCRSPCLTMNFALKTI